MKYQPLREIEKLRVELAAVLERTKALPPIHPIDYIERFYGLDLDAWQRLYCETALKDPRIAIVACRQSGKSTVTSGFGAWLMRSYPGTMILVASKSLNQAKYFIEKMREALAHEFERFPEDNKFSLMLPNGSRVVAIPAMNPDAGRGYSPDLVILDEAAFAHEKLLIVLSPSLAATQGAIHMISSPNGPTGLFYEAVAGKGKDVYWSMRIKYTDCPRITPEFIENERRLMSDHQFRQEYEAEFVAPQGAFFGYDALRTLIEDPEDTDYAELEKDLKKTAMWDAVLGLRETDIKAAWDRTDRVRRYLYDA